MLEKHWNKIVAGVYVGVGLLAMIILTAGGGGYIGFLTGLVIIMGGALVHEFIMRKQAYLETARGVVGIRQTIDRINSSVDDVKKGMDRATNDAKGANATALQVQQKAEATGEEIKSIQEQLSKGGSVNGELLPKLQEATKTAASDIELIQNAGNQLHTDFQAMQQQQAALRQQVEQLQANLVSLGQGGDAAPQPMEAPPPPPPSQAPPPEPPAEPPPAEPVAEAPVAPEQPADPAPAEQPAAPAEPAAAPAPQAAPSAAGFLGTVLGNLEGQWAAANSGSPTDASLRAVAEALGADTIDLYVEPIVTLPERKQAHFECYGSARGPDGSTLAVDQNLDLSEREPMMAAIENALMARSLDRIARLDTGGVEGAGCFYNVSGLSLGDRGFFTSLIGQLQDEAELAGKLVLEFSQAALMQHGESAVEDLVRLHDMGVRFSVDEVTDLEIDFESLVGFGFGFVKVGSKFIQVQAKNAEDADAVRGLSKTLKALGVDLIVENVETDLSLVELIGFEIGLGQGPLLGQPAAMENS